MQLFSFKSSELFDYFGVRDYLLQNRYFKVFPVYANLIDFYFLPAIDLFYMGF